VRDLNLLARRLLALERLALLTRTLKRLVAMHKHALNLALLSEW
jgi:hypothetical protein